jgi:hypothetical protein
MGVGGKGCAFPDGHDVPDFYQANDHASSLLGSLFGYDHHNDDILGSHRDPRQNCVACGMDVMRHSPEQAAKCAKRMFGTGDKS